METQIQQHNTVGGKAFKTAGLIFVGFALFLVAIAVISQFNGSVASAMEDSACTQGNEEECLLDSNSVAKAQDAYNEASLTVSFAQLALEQAENSKQASIEELAWEKAKALQDGGFPDTDRINELLEKAGLQ